MKARPRLLAAAFAGAAACAVLIASCAAPSNRATPPSSVTPSSSSSVTSSGPAITVPGLSTPESSTPVASSSAAKPTPTPTSTPEPAPPTPEPEPASTPEPEPIDTPEPEPAPAPAPEPAPAPAPAPGPVGGRVVVIDPGHNGANAANPDIINAQVEAGFGQMKACNTTGTSTNDGYSEHAFNWGVANYLRPMLESQGITVIMTRDSDDGVGPCVNKRAQIGNMADADVVVSIHGDGDEASAQGFYVMTAEQDPAGDEMASRSQDLAVSVRDGLLSAGLSSSNHLGSDGLWPRNDLAGLNLSLRPTVMIEAGNMRNDSDANLMSSAAGQQQVAQGLANGVLSYLGSG